MSTARMTENEPEPAERDMTRSELPEDIRLLLAEIEAEATPERLLQLAERLQAALSRQLGKSGAD